jgi:hypothetical protein
MVWRAPKEKMVSPEAMEASLMAADILWYGWKVKIGRARQDKLGCRIEIFGKREDVL